MSSSFIVQGLLCSLRPSRYTIPYPLTLHVATKLLSRVVDLAGSVCVEEIPLALCFAMVHTGFMRMVLFGLKGKCKTYGLLRGKLAAKIS